MYTCANTEIVKTHKLTDPANNSGLGVAVIHDGNFKMITVFNETNQDIDVQYKDEFAATLNTFSVPKNGRHFTRVFNVPVLKDSIRVVPETDSSGKVFINLGN